MPQSTNQRIVNRALGRPGAGSWRGRVAQTYEANKGDILKTRIAALEGYRAEYAEATANLEAQITAAKNELAAWEGTPALNAGTEPVEAE